MKKTLCACRATALVLSLQILPGAPGKAQAASPEQVTREGPYTIRQQPDWVRGTTMNDTKVSVSQQVTFADLDFSRQADLNLLRDRVKAAARDSCLELERRFPQTTYSANRSRHECIRDANRKGLAQAMTALQMKAMARR